MTHELILTSVSQGLEPNEDGYCIVAEDQNIPRQVTKRLETLSDYQHLFPPGSEESRFHPVVYSHLIFPCHQTIWHTLSRIADAGMDYRYKPNQLAHHIVLTENELVPEGSAWLLSLPGFHLTEWLTPSVRFKIGRPIPSLTISPTLTRYQRIARERRWTDPRKMALIVSGVDDSDSYQVQSETMNRSDSPCPLWQELTGDAGWAGILADTVRTGQQALLLFRPGLNILPLFFEAIAILPPELRWKGTFSTYYFKDLPEHIACQWKAVPVDSPMAEHLIQKNSDQLILDLTRPLGIIPPGAYVEFARTGSDEMLPKNEIPENLFHANVSTELPVFDEKPSQPATQPVNPLADQPVNPEYFAQPLKPNEMPPNHSDHSGIQPPVAAMETFRIQTLPPKQQNLFGSVLNMKSRGQFYLLYGVTLLLLFVLLLLVFDQVADWGLIRRFQGNKPKAVSVNTKKKETAKEDEKKTVQDKPDAVTIDEEKKIKEKEKQKEEQEQNRINAEQNRKKQLQDQAIVFRAEIEKRKQQILTELNEFLLEQLFPVSLPMPVPQFREDHVEPPEPKLFHELAGLYPFGLTLELQYVPLLEIPNVRVETRKLAFFRNIDAKDSEENSDSSLDQSDSELRVPVTDRFEWSVTAIDTVTSQETPVFDLKLTEQGLFIHWRLEGMDAQHLYDTFAASFGFLRVFAEGEQDMSKIKSIPLFEPKIQKPLFLAEHFIDPKNQEYSVEMPFAAEPWRSFFGTTKVPFAFRLDVTINPDTPEGIEKIDIQESKLSSEFFVGFQTEVQSKKTLASGAANTGVANTGSDTYLPVVISFEGAVEPERVVWHDRSNHQTEILKKESETNRANLETMKKDLDNIKKEILNVGVAATSEQRKKRNLLVSEIEVLENRNKEITDILNKIPLAHEKIVQNKQLRFNYSVYLIPVRDETTETTNPPNRQEESLLIMKTELPPESDNKN
ncbi:MAG: hypothetical protein LBQ50_11335 [Planctomycetaceae bacterium]|jgi:hypothetical protein|nr:hypothetical protein [Planctomycetaceae bacterium]